jgi:hypothetical protein
MKKRQLLATALLVLATATAPPSSEAQTTTTASAAPQPAPLTAEQWREDLRFMVAEMESRHHNLYHTVSRERFRAAVAELDARIPNLQRNEIVVGMMRIAAMVGDGHSRVDPRKDPKFGFRSLPLKLYLFEDGLYVRASAPEHAALVGARIDAVGGVPVDEAIRRVSELASRDNAIGPTLFVPLYLAMPDILHALKLSPRRDAAVLRLRKGGKTWTATVPAGAVDPIWPPDTDISLVTPDGWVDARATPRPPLWLQAPLDYHRMVELADPRALYVQLNMVADIKGQSLARFAGKIGERVAAANPRALILDLRLNHGGNGNLRNPLVRELIRAEDEDTRLFVLTWRGTFSASQFILDDLDRLTGAVFVGEPASSKPSSYGDAYRMPMPNSGISVRSSLVWWQAGQNLDPWTWVDVAAPLTFADYAAGRDPALEAALSYRPGPPLQERLLAAAGEGPEAVLRLVDAWRADPVNRWANLRLQIVRAAEGLHQAKQPAAALAVAEAAARSFPDYADAHNVLAHLAEAAGKADVARRAGARVLELDPNNRQARSLMERLAAGK